MNAIDSNLGFRKQVMYAFSVMGLMGNAAQLLTGFFGQNITDSERTVKIGLNAVLMMMWPTLIILTRLNRVNWAGTVFCSVSSGLISLTVLNAGLDNPLCILYMLVIVVAAAFITPLATVLFGILCSGFYAVVSAILISRIPPPAPPVKGAYAAVVILILLAVTGLLYGFSRSLGRLLRSARQQADELFRLNAAMQRQLKLENQTAHQVNDLSAVLSVIFREQNETSQEQAILVNDMATIAQELDAAARRIADNALSVATVAERAQRSVELGQEAAFEGVNTINTIRDRVQAINDNMQMLIQQIERIAEVTSIIGEIADETNLLALNATIEAAGAREYGRRFAAVADEVQRLARRAANAVEQIKETVVEISQASTKAMNATEQGLREAKVGDKLVASLTVANDEVINLVAQTSSLAGNIAGATQQQREASTQIVDIMQKLIVAANQLAVAGPEVSRIVTTLEETSRRLTHTIDQPPASSHGPSVSLTTPDPALTIR